MYRYLILLVFLTSSYLGKSQGDVHVNLPNYDDRQLHYGFQLGLNYSTFRVTHSQYFVDNDISQSVYGEGTPGFALGFILNYRLNEFMDLRLLPTVSFYERRVKFIFDPAQRPKEPEFDAIFESSFIEAPILLKYKSMRRLNNRMYMVAGVRPGIEVGTKKKEKREDQLRTNNVDLALEIGFGTDIYFPLFKFAPEIRFSLGLANLLNNDKNIYADNISRISTYGVAIYFMFE